MVCRFATVGMVIGSGANVHSSDAGAAFFIGGLFACVVVLLGYLARKAEDEAPLPTWTHAMRLVLSGQSVAGLRYTLCYVTARRSFGNPGQGYHAVLAVTALFVMRRTVRQHKPTSSASQNPRRYCLAALAVGHSRNPCAHPLGDRARLLLAQWSQAQLRPRVGLITAMTMVLLISCCSATAATGNCFGCSWWIMASAACSPFVEPL
jgi:hypothetical protein